MKRLRVGVLGCSSFAQKAMLPTIRDCKFTELVCVASRSAEKAQEVARIFECEPIVGYEGLITHQEIDVVYMPLPTGLHEEWCTKAVEAGKHVLVEKSFALDAFAAERMLSAAEKNNCLIVENFQFQHHLQWAEVLNWVSSGELGEIHLVRSTFGFPPLPKDNFRWNGELGGGALLDAGAYTAKVSQLLLGTELDVLGASLQFDTETGVDVYGEAMFRNRSGQVSQVAFGFDYFYQCRLELLGTKGKLSTDRIFTAPPGYSPTFTIETPESKKEIRLPADNHFMNLWNWFAKEIESGNFLSSWTVLLDQARLLSRMKECSQRL